MLLLFPCICQSHQSNPAAFQQQQQVANEQQQQRYASPQAQYQPQQQQTELQQQYHYRQPSPGVITLRKEAPITQQSAPVFSSDPVAASFAGQLNRTLQSARLYE